MKTRLVTRLTEELAKAAQVDSVIMPERLEDVLEQMMETPNQLAPDTECNNAFKTGFNQALKDLKFILKIDSIELTAVDLNTMRYSQF